MGYHMSIGTLYESEAVPGPVRRLLAGVHVAYHA
jgi:hypothetical protein